MTINLAIKLHKTIINRPFMKEPGKFQLCDNDSQKIVWKFIFSFDLGKMFIKITKLNLENIIQINLHKESMKNFPI